MINPAIDLGPSGRSSREGGSPIPGSIVGSPVACPGRTAGDLRPRREAPGPCPAAHVHRAGGGCREEGAEGTPSRRQDARHARARGRGCSRGVDERGGRRGGRAGRDPAEDRSAPSRPRDLAWPGTRFRPAYGRAAWGRERAGETPDKGSGLDALFGSVARGVARAGPVGAGAGGARGTVERTGTARRSGHPRREGGAGRGGRGGWRGEWGREDAEERPPPGKSYRTDRGGRAPGRRAEPRGCGGRSTPGGREAPRRLGPDGLDAIDLDAGARAVWAARVAPARIRKQTRASNGPWRPQPRPGFCSTASGLAAATRRRDGRPEHTVSTAGLRDRSWRSVSTRR